MDVFMCDLCRGIHGGTPEKAGTSWGGQRAVCSGCRWSIENFMESLKRPLPATEPTKPYYQGSGVQFKTVLPAETDPVVVGKDS